MKKYIFSIILLIVVVGGIGIFTYINNHHSSKPSDTKMSEVSEKVENYLITKQGYKKDEILSIKPQYDPRFADSDAAYSANVIFKDEKDVEYQYGITKNEVFQEGYSGKTDKPLHIE